MNMHFSFLSKKDVVVNNKFTAYKQKKKDHFEINSFLKVKKRQTFLIGVFDV